MEDKRDEGGGRLRDAVETGRDLYRRGTVAVARTAGDNQALILLAGGAVLAGASWLVMRRRAAKRDR